MMADREHPGCAYNSKQTGFFQVNTPFFGLELSKKPKAAFNTPCGSRQQFGEVISATRNIVCVAPQGCAKASISVHGTQIEEDIDCQQILRPGHAHPFLDAAVPCRRRAAPSRVLGHDAARAIRHADLVQGVSDLDTEFFEPSVGCATGLALGKNEGII